MSGIIKVVVAEDSLTTRELIVAILSSDAGIHVVGQAANGLEAVEMTRELRPDLVIMDMHMPQLGGLEATKRIMIETPTPIAIVSASLDTNEVENSMNALKVGALSLLPKPMDPLSPKFRDQSQQFIDTIKALAQVKVVRHWPDRGTGKPASRSRRDAAGARPMIVAIAASTGGPAALNRLLEDLPGNMPVPVLIAQHMAKGFIDGLAEWLNKTSILKVKVAEDGEPLIAGTVYLAPDDRHLGVSGRERILVSNAAPVGGFRPSADFLFASVAKTFGASTAAVILTGMGRDGVEGLREVRRAGGRVIAQDQRSSVVFGMPGAAIEAGCAEIILPLPDIAGKLSELVA